MKLYAWAVLVGGLGGGLLAGEGLGQATPPPPVEFTQNGDLFANGHRPKVSLKIYNVLAQLVAVPILQGTGEALTDLELTCGTAGPSPCAFSAYWDGNVLNTGAPAASGVYIYQLIVDGKRFTKKMIVMK